MANGLGGITLDQIAKAIGECIDKRMNDLMAKGLTREQAAKIVGAEIDAILWMAATSPSPLGDK